MPRTVDEYTQNSGRQYPHIHSSAILDSCMHYFVLILSLLLLTLLTSCLFIFNVAFIYRLAFGRYLNSRHHMPLLSIPTAISSSVVGIVVFVIRFILLQLQCRFLPRCFEAISFSLIRCSSSRWAAEHSHTRSLRSILKLIFQSKFQQQQKQQEWNSSLVTHERMSQYLWMASWCWSTHGKDILKRTWSQDEGNSRAFHELLAFGYSLAYMYIRLVINIACRRRGRGYARRRDVSSSDQRYREYSTKCAPEKNWAMQTQASCCCLPSSSKERHTYVTC